jgi:hypothetical protein
MSVRPSALLKKTVSGLAAAIVAASRGGSAQISVRVR